jgi:hypothetical protein
MSTIINNPKGGENSDNLSGTIIGIIIVIVLAVLFFVYAVPAIRNSDDTQEQPKNDTLDINVKLPNDSLKATTTQQ